VPAVVAAGARKTVGEDAAFQVLLEGLAHEGPGAVVVALPVKLACAGHLKPGIVMLGQRGDVAQLGRNRCQLGTGQKHVGILAKTVGEVTGARVDHRGSFAHLGLAAHAQRAAGQLSPSTSGAKGREFVGDK
jgi:hypothetical protein